MSPDSPVQSAQRRAWRFVSAFAAILAAFSVLVSVWLFTQIQQSRHDAVVASCQDTNRRHDATLRQLRQLVAELPDGPRKRRARDGMAGTVALIDALAPYRDCSALVRRTVKTHP